MPKFFLYSRINRVKSFITAAGWWKKFQMNTLLVRILLVGALLVMGGAYLGLINSTATRGFQVDDLNQKVTELRKENEKLEREAAEISSITHIQTRVSELGLVVGTQPEYASQDSGLALER